MERAVIIMNILILSVGSRNKIVQYFKRELDNEGRVYTTDCSPMAPALYDSDDHFIVPRIDNPTYLDEILQICQTHQIKSVFSLIDPELSLLAEHKAKFEAIGTTPLISSYDLVEMCFDKFKFHHYLLNHGFNTIKSYIHKTLFYNDYENGRINFPVFVKPISGSASININKVRSPEELDLLFEQYDQLLIQEFMDGTEIGADVYVDLVSRQPVSIFTKKKIVMRAGETDKSVAIKDDILFELIKRFVTEVGFIGMLDLDIFHVNGQYYISEVNPRFGGGYLHAYEGGVNFPQMIIRNLNGEANDSSIGQYKENTYMMKYNEIKFLEALPQTE